MRKTPPFLLCIVAAACAKGGGPPTPGGGCDGPPPDATNAGFVHGTVLRAEDDKPIVGAAARLEGVAGCVATDGEGKFTIPVAGGGRYNLKVEAVGRTHARRVGQVSPGHHASVGVLVLRRLDGAVTRIGPKGGEHRSENGGLRLDFPAGALDREVDVRATRFERGRELPAPLPRTSHFTMAALATAEDASLGKPITISFPNDRGFAPGTEVPVGHFDESTGLWEPDGMAVVSADGQEVVYEARHLSSYDCNLPPWVQDQPGLSPNDPRRQRDPCGKGGTSGSSIVDLRTGHMRLDVEIPLGRSLDDGLAFGLVYQSSSVRPGAWVGGRRDEKPEDLSATPEYAGIEVEAEGVRHRVYLKAAPDDNWAAWIWDGRNALGEVVPTGLYDAFLRVFWAVPAEYGTASVFGGPATGRTGVMADEPVEADAVFHARVPVVNGLESPVATGWHLRGIPRVYEHADGTILLVADGESLGVFPVTGRLDLFASAPGGAFTCPDGEPAPAQCLYFPEDLAVGPDGQVVIADSGNNAVRMVTAAGTWQTLYDGSSGSFEPQAVAVAPDGTVYVGDGATGSVFQIVSGTLVKVAGGDSVPLPGFPSQATVTNPTDLAFAPDGTLYIADGGYGLRRLKADGTLENAHMPDEADPPAAFGVAVAPDGSVVFAETIRQQVRRLGTDGRITRVAGRDGVSGIAGDDGPATEALLNEPRGLAVARDGTIFIGELSSHRVRAVDPSGRIRSVAGALNPDGSRVGIGDSALNAQIRQPVALAVDADGGLLVLGRIEATVLRVDFSTPTYGRPNSSNDRLTKTEAGWKRVDREGRVETFDGKGRLVERVDHKGRTTTIEYDAGDRPVAIDVSPGGRVSLAWGGDSLASITDASGRTTTLVAGAGRDLDTVVWPDGTRTEFTYNDHLMTGWRDAAQRTTTYRWDARGRISEVEAGDGSVRRYSPVESQGLINDAIDAGLGTSPKDPAPAIVAPRAVFQDANGHTVSIDYDSLGEPREATLGDGSRVQWVNHACGMPSRTTSPSGGRTTYTYDALGRLVREEGPLGERGFEWDPDHPDRFLTAWSWEGRTIRYQWTEEGDLEGILAGDMSRRYTIGWTPSHQVARVEDATGAYTSYAYDEHGNLSEITSNGVLVAGFTNDERGNIVSVVDAIGSRTSFEYDAMDRVVAVVDASDARHELLRDATGQVTGLRTGETLTTYTRDALGRIASVSLAGAPAWNLQWDGEDRVTGISSPLGSVTFGYDGRGRVSTRVVTTGSDVDAATFTWDPEDRLLSVEDDDSRIEWAYDEQTGLLKSVTQFHDGMAAPVTVEYETDRDGWVQAVKWPALDGFAGGRYEYDHDTFTGQVTWISDPEGLWYEVAVDEAGRIESFEIDWGEAWDCEYLWSPAGRLESIIAWADYWHENVLAQFVYELDADGKRLSETTPAGKATYAYDRMRRLSGAAYTDGRPAETFAYDSRGDPTGAGYQLDAARRLVKGAGFTYEWDDAGRAVRRTRDADQSRLELVWNGDDRLIEARAYAAGQTQPAHVVRYRYDGLGRRIAREVDGETTFFIYDGEDVALEVDGTGRAVAFFLHGPGIDQPLAMERDGETYVYVQDGIGTVRALVRLSDKQVVKTYQYSAFGRVLSETGTLPNPYGFQGRERDDVTGLVHFRNREYDPETGRFLTTDPMRFAAVWNPYAFPGMDPVNGTDPFGSGPRILQGAGRAAEWYSDLKSSMDERVQAAGRTLGSEAAGVGSMVFKGAAVSAFEASRFFPAGKLTPYVSPGPTVVDAASFAYKAYKARDPCERAKVAGDFLSDLLPGGKKWFKPMVDRFNNLGNLVNVGR